MHLDRAYAKELIIYLNLIILIQVDRQSESAILWIFKLLLYTVYTRKIFGLEALFFSAITTWKKKNSFFLKQNRIKSIMIYLGVTTNRISLLIHPHNQRI